ncbi:MAG: deoxyribodipyrimidine photo-lyase [Planctomycetota bacterium]
MRALMWFRSDLRVADNTALTAATRDAKRGVVAVFFIASAQWIEHDMAPVRAEFALRCLAELRGKLQSLNVPLLVRHVPRYQDASSELLALAGKHECDAVYFNDEYEWNERKRDEAVVDAFEASGRRAHRFTDQVVFLPGDIRTGDGGFYKVYSPFKRRWFGVLDEHGSLPSVPSPKKQRESVGVKAEPIPDGVDGFDFENRKHWSGLWPAGEKAAASRLDDFLAAPILQYKEQRDFPGVNATAMMSHHLSVGTISPRTCIAKAMEHTKARIDQSKDGPSHWISEVIWREFYRHIIVGFPRVSRGRAFDERTESIDWSNNKEHFEAWKKGQTGIPIVDAAMRQLLDVGWMHNRLRMIVASFLTKNLLVDWRWGERHFMKHLIDGDLAQNNGGWQWAASTGTDAQPYFRIFNPVSQSQKFDPDGTFLRRYLPELDDVDSADLHDPDRIAKGLWSPAYPEAVVDLKTSRKHAIEVFERVKKFGV